MKTVNTNTETKVATLGAVNRADANRDASIQVHGMRISRDLHEAEAALDEALIRQANLLATMVRARRATSVGPFTGQDALLRLAASQKAILQASGELARVHGNLIGVDNDVKAGLADDCPPAGSLGAEDASFEQVKAA